LAEAKVASRPALYAASHAQALERVMRVIDLIGARADITDMEVVAASWERVSARWTASC
jgi:hypothetical protein